MVRLRNTYVPYICTITDLNISNTHILCVTDSLSTSILTLIVLLAGFFNFFFTLAAFSVFVISLFSLIEDFSSRLALGATDLSHITIIVITIRIMAIAVLSNLVHYIVRRS